MVVCLTKTIAVIEHCRDIPKQIRMNKKIIKNIEDQYYYPASVEFDGQPRGKGGTSSPTEMLALNIPDGVSKLRKDLEKENKKLERLYNAVMKEIRKLEYREQKVIYEFYIQGYMWRKISQGFYSIRQCKNIRNEAIKKLKKQFSENQEIKLYIDDL